MQNWIQLSFFTADSERMEAFFSLSYPVSRKKDLQDLKQDPASAWINPYHFFPEETFTKLSKKPIVAFRAVNKTQIYLNYFPKIEDYSLDKDPDWINDESY